MGVADRYVTRDGVRLHVVANAPAEPGGTPLLLVPGMADLADDFREFLPALEPRPAVAMTMRGRRGSDAPDSGYATRDHAEDIRAVVDALGWDRIVLLSHSRGTTYALGFALAWPARLAGLVIGDYRAQQTGLPEQFPAVFGDRHWRGAPARERIPTRVLEAMQRDAAETVELWEELHALTCPVLTLRGTRGRPMLDDEAVERYDRHLVDHRHRVLPEASHDLWVPDQQPLLDTLTPFLREIDEREARQERVR